MGVLMINSDVQYYDENFIETRSYYFRNIMVGN